MAEFRARPYAQFNFLVEIDGGADAADAKAGFQEVSGLSMEITAAEYRAGNYKENSPMKITTLHKLGDVTLKRGVMGALDLYTWIDAVRNGKQDQLKTVTISLQDESHEKVAMKWILKEARPVRYTGPTMSGNGSEVAVEELVLAFERLELA